MFSSGEGSVMHIPTNVARWGGVACAAVGIGLVAYAIRSKTRNRRRVRGPSDDTRVALGGPGGVRLQDGIVIRRTPGELYSYWRTLERLPDVMPDLDRVERVDDRRSHWVLFGPAGVRLEWDAEIINDVPGKLIGWRSLPGADVVNAGSVRFRPARGGTELVVTMQYEPPGGKIGAGMAWLAGQGAERKLRENLKRLKRTLEDGHFSPNGSKTERTLGQTFAMESSTELQP